MHRKSKTQFIRILPPHGAQITDMYCCSSHSPLLAIPPCAVANTYTIFVLVASFRCDLHDKHGRNSRRGEQCMALLPLISIWSYSTSIINTQQIHEFSNQYPNRVWSQCWYHSRTHWNGEKEFQYKIPFLFHGFTKYQCKHLPVIVWLSSTGWFSVPRIIWFLTKMMYSFY